jgi:hypothetical protein
MGGRIKIESSEVSVDFANSKSGRESHFWEMGYPIVLVCSDTLIFWTLIIMYEVWVWQSWSKRWQLQSCFVSLASKHLGRVCYHFSTPISPMKTVIPECVLWWFSYSFAVWICVQKIFCSEKEKSNQYMYLLCASWNSTNPINMNKYFALLGTQPMYKTLGCLTEQIVHLLNNCSHMHACLKTFISYCVYQS